MVTKNPEVLKKMESLRVKLTFGRELLERDARGQLSELGIGDNSIKKLFKELVDYKGKVKFKGATPDSFKIVFVDDKKQNDLMVQLKSEGIRVYFDKERYREYLYKGNEIKIPDVKIENTPNKFT